MDKKTLFLLAFAIIVAVIFVVAVPAKNRKSAFSAKAKKPLTKNEQPMYFRLIESFPDLIVLAQVSFSALMSSTTTASRNKFDRKTADFFLCTKSFELENLPIEQLKRGSGWFKLTYEAIQYLIDAEFISKEYGDLERNISKELPRSFAEAVLQHKC